MGREKNSVTVTRLKLEAGNWRWEWSGRTAVRKTAKSHSLSKRFF
jgi:hypothetical protein